MQVTRLQDEVIDKAHSEGQVNPDDVVHQLHHALHDVQAVIHDLVVRGPLDDADGNIYRLTTAGHAVHRAREKADSDAVKMNTRTWQTR